MALERIQKFLSGAGIASRRKAEELILNGRVRVNGKVVEELGTKVDPSKDKVAVNGKMVKSVTADIYYVLNKPANCVSSRKDAFSRKTVYDYVPADIRSKVWSVGRLDYETEGLLIFTNDGELTNKLTHPKFEHNKTYEVIVDRPLRDHDIGRLERGVDIGGFTTSPAQADKLSPTSLHLTIHEGKNRQVRRMLGALGYTVVRLIRIEEAGLRLDLLGLKTGRGVRVSRNDILQ